MRQFEADANLLRVFQEYLLVGGYDESGGVSLIIIDIVRQHRQAMHFGRICAAHGRLGLILLIQHLLCRDRRIGHADLLPVAVLVQEAGCLHQSHAF